ncbi:hypothetical protein [Lacimicrobium alkaliphilum]|uniref:Uncharacterized protein n=1 Tax=Lacimicrobium alkaliphilum TaxID=1526571 RepID=A0A0U3AE28_9ALTE|nr:hypothetical protein [Lacimicrobium alkaliphilum]ALS96961.1 hypothetical protein AT746_00810 [Lacimicrobium alkaliphilum]
MKRTVVLLLEIASLLVILRSSFAQYLLTDMQHSLSGWIAHVAEMGERKVLSDLQKRISPYIANLNEYQHDYIMDITSSRGKIEHFQRYYCQTDDKNPYVYGNTRIYLCSEIRKVEF